MGLPNLREVMLLAAIAHLGAIYGVHAEDAKDRHLKVRQDGPRQERPNTLPADTMREPGTTTTGHDEIDSKITRPRTQDDVIREILSNQPIGHANPVPPR